MLGYKESRTGDDDVSLIDVLMMIKKGEDYAPLSMCRTGHFIVSYAISILYRDYLT